MSSKSSSISSPSNSSSISSSSKSSSISSPSTMRQRSNTNITKPEEMLDSVILHIEKMNGPAEIKLKMKEHLKNMKIIENNDVLIEAGDTDTNQNFKSRLTKCIWDNITYVVGTFIAGVLLFLLKLYWNKTFKTTSITNNP